MELDGGVAAFASMFSNVRDGRPLKLVDAQQATSKIITRVGQDGLSTWLDEVRRYHEGTFQHCLLVTGIAVAFGLDVGFSGGDVVAARNGGDPARHRQGAHPAVDPRQAGTP